ncbi:MAG TPA: cation diffusion facilitator family transporter [Sphingopyxis sp.]|nr:cation diffusion facilitator family transporter [Sphingopyxis sp.]
MGQDHSHDHVAGANARMLGWALALTATFLIVEVAGGLYFNSLALLSDAGHMLTDVAALAIALLAIRLGAKPPDDRRTFGYRRVEILAAVFNALMLFAIAIYVFVEAIARFRDPQPVQSWGMMVVAAVGLLVNLIAMRMLVAGKEASFNVKGAYLEVWADMIGSVGVIVGAVLIRFTGWTWVDPVVAVLIGLWVLPRTWILLRGTVNVLLEGVPDGIDLGEVRDTVRGVPGIVKLRQLHLWSISNGQNRATVHAVASPESDIGGLQREIAERLHDRFDIADSTIQIELAVRA